jgi:hypothetical protein
MIAKFTHGNNFLGAVDYVHRDDLKTDARIIGFDGVCIVSNQAIADSFYLQSQMRPNTSDPVRHISISFHPDDAPRFPDNDTGDRFMYELAREWMREMNISNTQYLIVRHHDHEHPHCHLVFNLVDNDGNVINMSNDLQRNVEACKRIKNRYGLTYGKSDGKRINADRLRGYAKHRHNILMAAAPLWPRRNRGTTFASSSLDMASLSASQLPNVAKSMACLIRWAIFASQVPSLTADCSHTTVLSLGSAVSSQLLMPRRQSAMSMHFKRRIIILITAVRIGLIFSRHSLSH